MSKRSATGKKTDQIALGDNRNQRVWTVVGSIPSGSVATYGQVARLAGISGPTGARQVGYALSALAKQNDVPWHRVVNARGELSPRADPDAIELQLLLLEAEGIEFNHCRQIDLGIFTWQPTG